MQTPTVVSQANISDITGSRGLETLRHAAAHNDPAAAKATAQKFESLFAEQLVKTMRQTSMGDSMFPGSSTMYRDLYDHEVAKKLTQGKGLGLQPMIRRSLGDKTVSNTNTNTSTSTNPTNTSLQNLQHNGLTLANYMRALPPQTKPTAIDAAQPVAKPATDAAQRLPSVIKTPQASYSHGSGRISPPTSDASATAASHRAPNRTFSSAEDFVAQVLPHAQRAAAELGVTPNVLIAQAALETGWGKHTAGNNNLFGIKAGSHWTGATRTLHTTEFSNGTPHTEAASFRSYTSVGDSFDDYVKLIKNNPRYAGAVGSGLDNVRFASALQKAGYATDPAYARKIAALAATPVVADAVGVQKFANAPLLASR
jgi:flagellar protein FlgJ